MSCPYFLCLPAPCGHLGCSRVSSVRTTTLNPKFRFLNLSVESQPRSLQEDKLFSAAKEYLPTGFVVWEVEGFSGEHSTPTVISIRKSHWLQKIFEDLIWRLLCFVTVLTEAFPKHSTGHLQEFETRPRLFCFLKSRIYPCPWVSEACSSVLNHICS